MIRADDTATDSWFLRGVVAPLGLVMLAILVFLQAGSQGSLGPLSLASVNFLVAGLWGLALGAGGLLVRPLPADERRRSMLIVGAVLGIVIGLVGLIGAGTGGASCGASASPNALLFAAGGVAVGAAVAVGSSIAMALACVVGRRSAIVGVLLGAVVGSVAVVVPFLFYITTVSCYH